MQILKMSLITFILFTSKAYAICLPYYEAGPYFCKQKQDDSLHKACQEKFDDIDAFDYYLTDSCNYELAVEVYGDELVKKEEIENELRNVNQDEVICLDSATIEKKSCEIRELDELMNYCKMRFGMETLPVYKSDTCTAQLALNSGNFLTAQELNEGLEEGLSEIESIMFMIDREGLNNALIGKISSKPIITKTFYTPVMKSVLIKLEQMKKEIEERSFEKINFSDFSVVEFINNVNRYISLVKRVNKVYAYSAHLNHKEMDSYKFENLNFLNLVIDKKIGLELLSKAQYGVKHLPDGALEFLITEQEKQVFEYEALSEPMTGVDFAKLITFLGIRENITNNWALDKFSEKNLLTSNIYKCSDGFLSLRTNSGAYLLEDLPTVQENKRYELFYNEYLPKAQEIKKALDQQYLSDFENFSSSLKKTYLENEKLMNFLKSRTDFSFDEYFVRLIENIKDTEKAYWSAYIDMNISNIILPHDNIFSKDSVIELLLERSFKYKEKIINDHLISLFARIPQELSLSIKEKMQTEIYVLIDSYKWALRPLLSDTLKDYGNKKVSARQNLATKEQSILNVMKTFVPIAHDYYLVSEGKKAVDYSPVDMQDLKVLFENRLNSKYQDLKYAVSVKEDYAEFNESFFKKIDLLYKKEIKKKIEDLKTEGIAITDVDKREILNASILAVAREYYANYFSDNDKFQKVDNVEKVLRAEHKSPSNPYMLQLHKDGTPIYMHVNEIYKSLEAKTNLVIDHRDRYYRLDKMLGYYDFYLEHERNLKDEISNKIGQESSLSDFLDQGAKILGDEFSEFDHSSLKRLYLTSIDTTKYEIGENKKLDDLKVRNQRLYQMEEGAKADQYGKLDGKRKWIYKGWYTFYKKIEFETQADKEITSKKKLLKRIFASLDLNYLYLDNKNLVYKFNLSSEEVKTLLQAKLAQAFYSEPVLRNEVKITEIKRELIVPHKDHMTPYFMDVEKETDRNLLMAVAIKAYDSETKEIEKTRALEYISEVFAIAKENIINKVNRYCKASYINYKTDKEFKFLYNTTDYLRSTLMSSLGTTPANAKKIAELDTQVGKEIRTKWEAFNEEVIEPGFLIIMGVMVIGMAVMLSAASMGTAAPVLLTGAAAAFGKSMAIMNVVFVPMILISTSVRINTQFIETPAQLKFQKSLAQSQITASRIADHEQTKGEEKENMIAGALTIGLLPLDILFGVQLGNQVKAAIGLTGVKAYKKLTGLNLPKYKSNSEFSDLNKSFNQLRKDHSLIGASLQKMKYAMNPIKAKLPRYQNISSFEIERGALTAGLKTALTNLKLGNNPWKIGDYFKNYKNQLKDRLVVYNKYTADKNELLKRIELERSLSLTEIREFGFKYSKLAFRFGHFYKWISRANYRKALEHKNPLMQRLNIFQGKIFQRTIEKLDTIGHKISDFKLKYSQLDELSSAQLDEFLGLFTKEELQLLERVSKRNKYELRDIYKVFKTHKKLMESLKPMSYLYGKIGVEYGNSLTMYNGFLGDFSVDTLNHYQKANEAEQIVKYYESLVQQSPQDTVELQLLREQIEELIQHNFDVLEDGTRVYTN